MNRHLFMTTTAAFWRIFYALLSTFKKKNCMMMTPFFSFYTTLCWSYQWWHEWSLKRAQPMLIKADNISPHPDNRITFNLICWLRFDLVVVEFVYPFRYIRLSTSAICFSQNSFPWFIFSDSEQSFLLIWICPLFPYTMRKIGILWLTLS